MAERVAEIAKLQLRPEFRSAGRCLDGWSFAARLSYGISVISLRVGRCFFSTFYVEESYLPRCALDTELRLKSADFASLSNQTL